MDPDDHELLTAIDRGERRFDWEAWFGLPHTGAYLTEHGTAVAHRAAADLTTFLGKSWLPTATEPGSCQLIPELGAASVLLAPSEARRVSAYVETLRWWASLQLMLDLKITGAEALRKDVRKDITAVRFRHTLAQARLGALGASKGLEVVVEPAKIGGPGDVLLRAGKCEVFIEAVTSLPVPNHDEVAYDGHVNHLLTIEGDLHWEGDVPGLLNRTDELFWFEQIAAAAATCGETGESVVVDGRWGRLIVHQGAAPEGSTLHGPSVAVDHSTRLARVIDGKAAQTRGAGIAWIWIEDHGGLHPLTPFAAMPLEAKLAALEGLCRPLLDDRPHVGGIVWTRTARTDELRSDEAHSNRGFALERSLPGGQVRQSIVVHRRVVLPDQLRVLEGLCTSEPAWLDWALRRLGVGSLAGCLS